jgi:hypothetical protein
MMDCTCIAVALLFCGSNLARVIERTRMWKSGAFHYDDYKELDPTYMEELWQERDKDNWLHMAIGFLYAVAWLMLCVPVMQFAWIQSQHGKRQLGLHSLLVALALGGSLSEMIARLMLVGLNSTAKWIASSFNLDSWTSEGDDKIGWRVLEMVHLMTSGTTTTKQ